MARKWTDLLDAAVGFAGMAAIGEIGLTGVFNAIPQVRSSPALSAAAAVASAAPALWLGWRFALKSYFGNRAMREWEDANPGKTNLDHVRLEAKARAEGRELAGSVFEKRGPDLK